MESVGNGTRLLIGGSGDGGRSLTVALLFSVLLLMRRCCGVQSSCNYLEVVNNFLFLSQLLAPPSPSPRRMPIGPALVFSAERWNLFSRFFSLSLSFSEMPTPSSVSDGLTWRTGGGGVGERRQVWHGSVGQNVGFPKTLLRAGNLNIIRFSLH